VLKESITYEDDRQTEKTDNLADQEQAAESTLAQSSCSLTEKEPTETTFAHSSAEVSCSTVLVFNCFSFVVSLTPLSGWLTCSGNVVWHDDQ